MVLFFRIIKLNPFVEMVNSVESDTIANAYLINDCKIAIMEVSNGLLVAAVALIA